MKEKESSPTSQEKVSSKTNTKTDTDIEVKNIVKKDTRKSNPLSIDHIMDTIMNDYSILENRFSKFTKENKKKFIKVVLTSMKMIDKMLIIVLFLELS